MWASISELIAVIYQQIVWASRQVDRSDTQKQEFLNNINYTRYDDKWSTMEESESHPVYYSAD